MLRLGVLVCSHQFLSWGNSSCLPHWEKNKWFWKSKNVIQHSTSGVTNLCCIYVCMNIKKQLWTQGTQVDGDSEYSHEMMINFCHFCCEFSCQVIHNYGSVVVGNRQFSLKKKKKKKKKYFPDSHCPVLCKILHCPHQTSAAFGLLLLPSTKGKMHFTFIDGEHTQSS